MSEVGRQFDCFTRLLVFTNLFALVEYSPNQNLWHARVENRRIVAPTKMLTRSNYSALVRELDILEHLEKGDL